MDFLLGRVQGPLMGSVQQWVLEHQNRRSPSPNMPDSLVSEYMQPSEEELDEDELFVIFSLLLL